MSGREDSDGYCVVDKWDGGVWLLDPRYVPTCCPRARRSPPPGSD
jgi:hypothetical protein